MKNRRYSEISESDSSDGAQVNNNVSSRSPSKVNNNKSARSDSSSSYSDSEPNVSQQTQKSSTFVKHQPPSARTPLQKFLDDNPDLTKLDVNEILTEDDQVCYLEIPQAVDPQSLLGKVINFDKRTKIKINKTRYVIEPNFEDIKPITVLTNSLQVVYPVANLQFREYHKRKHEGDAETEPVIHKPALPENLKVRHPLFGAKYETKIVLDEEIQCKLDNTIDKFMSKLKKKKHKLKNHSKEFKDETQREDDETGFTTVDDDFQNYSHEKKKKKRKKKERDESERTKLDSVCTFLGEDDVECAVGVEKKKKKHKMEKRGEHLDNEYDDKTDLKHKKNDVINSTMITDLQLPSFNFDISGILNNKDGSSSSRQIEKNSSIYGEELPKKKRKNDTSASNSNLQDENGHYPIGDTSVFYNLELNGEMNNKRKKKRKKHDSISYDTYEDMEGKDESSHLEINNIDNEESGAPSKKKHKKKKKNTEEEKNNIILDLLSQVKCEMNDTKEHKKKKKSDKVISK